MLVIEFYSHLFILQSNDLLNIALLSQFAFLRHRCMYIYIYIQYDVNKATRPLNTFHMYQKITIKFIRRLRMIVLFFRKDDDDEERDRRQMKARLCLD